MQGIINLADGYWVLTKITIYTYTYKYEHIYIYIHVYTEQRGRLLVEGSCRVSVARCLLLALECLYSVLL